MDENYYYDDYDETGAPAEPVRQKPVRKYAPIKKGVSPADILSSMRLAMVNGRLVMVSTNPDLADEKGNWTVNPYTGNAIQPPQPSPYWSGGVSASAARPGVGAGPQYYQHPAAPPTMPLTAQQKQQLLVQQYRQRQEAIKNAMDAKGTRMNFVGAGAPAPAPAPVPRQRPAAHMGRFMFKG